MGVPNKMKEIEVDEVVRLLNEHKSLPKVARILDMTTPGLFQFIKRKNIEKQVRWFRTA